MNIKKYLNNIRIRDEEKVSICEEFQKRNIARLNISLRFLLPLFILFVFVFSLDYQKWNLIERQWRIGIITAHSITFFVLSFILISAYYINKKDIFTIRYSYFITHFTYIFTLLMGGVLAIIDQLVTTSINPFMISCLVMPLFLIIHPKFTLAWYLSTTISFLLLEPITQSNPSILLSNTANGLAAATIGYALSVILWQITLSKARQERVISKQKEELEEQNAELIRKSEELRQAIQTKDKFFSIISHDLKSPFQGFIGLTQMMAEGNIDFSRTEITEYGKALFETASTVYKLLENLLEWAKMQKNEIDFTPKKFSISETAGQIADAFAQRAGQKEILIVDNIPQNLNAYGDEKMINSVLRNLLSNAVKFTNRKGRVTISAHETEDKMIQVSVEDNGIGMPPDDIKNLFRLDKKVSSPGTEGEPSSGLGLLLCKEFVERNSGKIWAGSIYGTGSTFTFTLPSGGNN
jgi:signal transduction histidine kinase